MSKRFTKFVRIMTLFALLMIGGGRASGICDDAKVSKAEKQEGAMNPVKFAHVAITCQDQTVIENFYTKYFGFTRLQVLPLSATEQIILIGLGDVALELFPAKETLPVPKATGDGVQYPGFRHIAFLVNDVEAKLAELGSEAKISAGPFKSDTFTIVWIADPEGNIIELIQAK